MSPHSFYLPSTHPLLEFSQIAVYQNLDDLHPDNATSVASDTDPYGFGDEKIYDFICYYQAPVSLL